MIKLSILKNKKFLSSFIILTLFFTSCITYRNFPVEKIGQIPEKKAKPSKTLFYNIKGHTMFSGEKELLKVFQEKSPFITTERADKKTERGLFVEVNIHKIAPHTGAAILGYASASFLGFIPFWSTDDGYNLQYVIYKNGKRKKSFEYKIHRNSFFWVFMIPLAWVNAFTYSETDAFEATTYQFFEEADSILHY